jgi:DNA-binding response OmpR family regulator
VSGPEILVVEDDADLAALVAWILEAEGYGVRTASHGQEALEALASYRPALILLDMRMPVMDGWRFAAELAVRGPHPPILVMTAAEDARSHAIDIGTPHWIAKPFDLDALIDRVRGLVGRPTVAGPA